MKSAMRFLLMFVLACPAMVVAQTGMSSDSSMKKSDAMSKMTTITGCVAEKDGHYTIADKNHPGGVMLMGSENMKPHVGHKMSVTGTMEHMSNMGKMSHSAMSDDSKSNMSKDNMGTMGLKITSMKMISSHCEMPNSMSNMSK